MRPIMKVKPPESAFAHPVPGLLMNATGEYCSFCERKLHAEVWMFHKKECRVIDDMPLESSYWKHILLIGHNCRLALMRNSENTGFGKILYPDQHPTFGLGDDAHFIYELKQVSRFFLAPDGKPEGEPEEVDMALVRGTTAEAKATIDCLELNSAYYDAEKNVMRIPRSHHNAVEDGRVDERTAVWREAVKLANNLGKVKNGPHFDIMVESSRLVAAGMGYWSVWATVLWKELGDRTVLERILLPPAANLPGGPSPENTHPGTDRGWLDSLGKTKGV